MKTSVITEEFRRRYLSNPKDSNAFEGRAIVFDGPEDYHQRGMVDELANGMVLKPAVKYQKIHEKKGLPRDNH